MEEKIVRLKELEWGSPAMTLRDKNGDYNIYVDPRQSHYVQQSAYQHEIAHIDKQHFFQNDKSLQTLEDEADENI